MSKKNQALTRPNYSHSELEKCEIPFAHLKNHELRYLFALARKVLHLGDVVDELFTEIGIRLGGRTDTDYIDLDTMHYIRVMPEIERKFRIGDLVEVKREFRYGDFFTKSDIWQSGVVVGYGNNERINSYKIDYHHANTVTDWDAIESNMRIAINPKTD